MIILLYNERNILLLRRLNKPKLIDIQQGKLLSKNPYIISTGINELYIVSKTWNEF